MAALRGLRRGFEAAKVDLVIAVGGLGQGADEIGAVLAAIGDDAPWPVVAIPGDREALAGHREAIAAAGRRGALVVDGGVIAAIELAAAGGVTIATLPGGPHDEQLIAGLDGCRYDEADARRVAADLAGRPGIRILATHVAPQQRGRRGSDLARGGIHAGDAALAAAIAALPPDVVLHGQIDEAALDVRGATAAPAEEPVLAAASEAGARAPIYLAAGAAEAVRGVAEVGGDTAVPAGVALVVTVEPPILRWHRLTSAAGGSRVPGGTATLGARPH
jgi:hypothetical protein